MITKYFFYSKITIEMKAKLKNVWIILLSLYQRKILLFDSQGKIYMVYKLKENMNINKEQIYLNLFYNIQYFFIKIWDLIFFFFVCMYDDNCFPLISTFILSKILKIKIKRHI